VLKCADDVVDAAVSRATTPLIATLRSARADGVVDAKERATLYAAVDAADAEVSAALTAIKPTVAYAVWAAMNSARAANPVDGKAPKPGKVADAVRRVRGELVKSREGLSRRVARVAAEVGRTLAGVDAAPPIAPVAARAGATGPAGAAAAAGALKAVPVRAANGVLPVVLRLRAVAERWGGLIDEVAAAAAAATVGRCTLNQVDP
jgi:hypothetical protein